MTHLLIAMAGGSLGSFAIGLAVLLVPVIVITIVIVYGWWRRTHSAARSTVPAPPSAPASAPAGTQTTAKTSGWLKTFLFLAVFGAVIYWFGNKIYEAEMASRGGATLSGPVTLACDPTKYNTTLLANRKANEWVSTSVNPGCDATERVAIPLNRQQIRTDSRTDIDMRLFGPNNKIIRVDGADPDGWFTDGPTMRINASDAIAVQLRNKSSATKSTLLASS